MKYIIGTEQGFIVPLKKAKTMSNQNPQPGKEFSSNYVLGKEQESHHGPIYSLSQHRKHVDLFLSVGDWSAKIWQEDTITPIYSTTYHNT